MKEQEWLRMGKIHTDYKRRTWKIRLICFKIYKLCRCSFKKTLKLEPTVSYQAIKLGVFKLLLCILFNQ